MRASILLRLFLLLLITYTLPWVVNPGAGLSPGGYDLAEWASIHPVAGGESPPLLTALLLRLPLVCAVVSFAFFLAAPNWNDWIIGGAAVILMGIALLPPFEFLSDTGNLNYQQQLTLSTIATLGGILGLSGWMENFRRSVGISLALIGIAACLMGLSRVYALMEGFALPAQIGSGGVGTAILFGVLVIWQWQIGRHVVLRRPIRTAKAN